MKKGQKPANVPEAPAAKRAAAAAAAAAAATKAKAAKPEEGAAAPPPAEVKTEGGQSQPSSAPRAAAAAAAARKKKPAPQLVGQHPSNTLLVFNLAAQTTEKQLFKRVKKLQPPTSVKTQVWRGRASSGGVCVNGSLARSFFIRVPVSLTIPTPRRDRSWRARAWRC